MAGYVKCERCEYVFTGWTQEEAQLKYDLHQCCPEVSLSGKDVKPEPDSFWEEYDKRIQEKYEKMNEKNSN